MGDTNNAGTERSMALGSTGFRFAHGPLVDQVPFRVHGKAGDLLDRFAEKHGAGSRTEYVRRVVYERLADELEAEAAEVRLAVGG